MKNKRQLSVIFLGIFAIFCANLFSTLSAQKTDSQKISSPKVTAETTYDVAEVALGQPIARNYWEDIYFRIEKAFSAASLFELLKSMELAENQAELASSYAIILKEQIYSYSARYKEEPIYTAMIIEFLLDKIIEQAHVVAEKNPEVANVIGLTLIPALDYNAMMGKANAVLGHLDAEEFLADIIKRLGDINYIMATNAIADDLGLNYSAAGCMEALMLFDTPLAFSVLFQVKHGSFNQVVRRQATRLMAKLKKEHRSEVEENFLAFIKSLSTQLPQLNLLADNLSEGEFSFVPGTVSKINLTLLTRMNESSWAVSASTDANAKVTILLQVIANIIAQGADGLEDETSAQLQLSYMEADNTSVKILALQAIGELKSPIGLEFLWQEVSRQNMLQRSLENHAVVNHVGPAASSDERIVRQLLSSLLVSRDFSRQTIAALRAVSVTPYPAAIRRLALDILQDLSQL